MSAIQPTNTPSKIFQISIDILYQVSNVWDCVAMSRNGKIIIATTSDNYLYRSIDYGVTWYLLEGILTKIAISESRQIIHISQSSGSISSSDYGLT